MSTPPNHPSDEGDPRDPHFEELAARRRQNQMLMNEQRNLQLIFDVSPVGMAVVREPERSLNARCVKLWRKPNKLTRLNQLSSPT